MFNEQIGAEVEVSYLAGDKNQTYYQSINQWATVGNNSAIISAESYARMLLFQPALAISTDLSEKIDLYGKFGVTVAKGYIKYTSDWESDQDVDTEAKYEGG